MPTVLFDDPNPQEIIYGVADSGEPERVRYVGRTRFPAQRYRGYCRGAGANDAMRLWLAELLAAGRHPVLLLLEDHDPALHRQAKGGAVSVRESWWIERLRADGQADLNVHTRPMAESA